MADVTIFASGNADGNAIVSVSTRFNPGEPDIVDADLVLFTVDNVFFYVHSRKILRQSANHFGGFVPEDVANRLALGEPADNLALDSIPTLLAVPYSSDVLNLILHLVYGFSAQTYRPTTQVFHSLIPTLEELGYTPHTFLTPGSEIFNMILQAAAENPLPTYALAAQYALEPLAVAVSALTLSESLSNLNDEQARQMGPKYLKRLFFLHLGRTDALKRLLLPPPVLHPPSSNLQCSADSQKAVSRAWALACAYIMVDGCLDSLAMSLLPLSAHLRCVSCRNSMEERVTSLVRGWNEVKRTI